MKPVDASTDHTSYTCPMHPQVQQDKPGKCPKCGMDLVPQGRSRGEAPKQEEKGRKPAAPAEPVSQTDQCDPLPAKHPTEESTKPACPEGYPDRQPTEPPAQKPGQRPH